MGKMTVTIQIGKVQHTLHEDEWYCFEFKPEYKLGDSLVCNCQVLNLSFEHDGKVYFLVLEELSKEDYLICVDELLRVKFFSPFNNINKYILEGDESNGE
ncbi:MAG: hypothetical protein K0S34_1019 [Bacillales bacterium]|jgi:hypothetical protein|nr:hypothetical protein [Bacillales bacterium]